jgi:hypothetical protein
VLAHPWVTGEIALGQLADRDNVLALLGNLPQAQVATDRELARFISDQRLYALGVAYVDAQLLAATRLTPNAQLWTRDRRRPRSPTDTALGPKLQRPSTATHSGHGHGPTSGWWGRSRRPLLPTLQALQSPPLTVMQDPRVQATTVEERAHLLAKEQPRLVQAKRIRA